MDAAWKALEAAGVPLGAPRRRIAGAGWTAWRAALDQVAAGVDGWTALEREAVHAWLCAFASEWPAAFASALGPGGRALLGRLDRQPHDPGRHVKLRRIAKGNLAELL